MSKNFETYLAMDKSNLIDRYVIIVDGKIKAIGADIEKMLKAVTKAHPHKIPFVAKVPDQKLLVLISLK